MSIHILIRQNVAIISTMKAANEYLSIGFISFNTNEIESWLHQINILTHAQQYQDGENLIRYVWSNKMEMIKLPQTLSDQLQHRLKFKL